MGCRKFRVTDLASENFVREAELAMITLQMRRLIESRSIISLESGTELMERQR